MKTIVVTGATKGIGKAIVEKFASEGFEVAFCARNPTDLAHFKQALENRYPGVKVFAQPADMRNKAEVLAFARFLQTQWQQVDVLVNNAGIFVSGEIHKEEDGILEQMIETNLYSAYHFTRAMMPTLLKQGKGHIFNMCSVASLFAYPNGGAYSISKFALLGFSKVLREELKGLGIKVTALLPGATWSDSWGNAPYPESRLMQAEDIALAVWAAWQMGPAAVVEEILIRPQLGDL
jgi:short-subunit dehydrogenase